MVSPVGLLGSGEFLPWAAEVDRFLLSRARTGNGSVVVVPTASAPEGDAVFKRWGAMGIEHYRSLGIPATAAPIKTREDASRPVPAVEEASLVFFSGGNPAYLARVLDQTPFWETVRRRMAAGMAVAGCSAGACIFGEQAPDPRAGSLARAFRQPGLRVFRGVVFNAHWDQLDTFAPNLRQIATRAVPDGCVMVGIDEQTAIVTEDRTWHVIGAGAAHVFVDRREVAVYRTGASFELPRARPA